MSSLKIIIESPKEVSFVQDSCGSFTKTKKSFWLQPPKTLYPQIQEAYEEYIITVEEEANYEYDLEIDVNEEDDFEIDYQIWARFEQYADY